MTAKKQVWASIVFIVLSIFYLACTVSIKVVNIFGVTVVSSATIPRALGVIMLILSAIQFLNSIRDYRAEKKETVSGAKDDEVQIPAEKEGELDVKAALAEAEKNEDNVEVDVVSIVQTIGCLVLFALLMEPLGFLLSAFIYLVLQITVLTKREERRKKLLFTIIISAVFSALIYYLFTKGLSLMLPAGILG